MITTLADIKKKGANYTSNKKKNEKKKQKKEEQRLARQQANFGGLGASLADSERQASHIQAFLDGNGVYERGATDQALDELMKQQNRAFREYIFAGGDPNAYGGDSPMIQFFRGVKNNMLTTAGQNHYLARLNDIYDQFNPPLPPQQPISAIDYSQRLNLGSARQVSQPQQMMQQSLINNSIFKSRGLRDSVAPLGASIAQKKYGDRMLGIDTIQRVNHDDSRFPVRGTYGYKTNEVMAKDSRGLPIMNIKTRITDKLPALNPLRTHTQTDLRLWSINNNSPFGAALSSFPQWAGSAARKVFRASQDTKALQLFKNHKQQDPNDPALSSTARALNDPSKLTFNNLTGKWQGKIIDKLKGNTQISKNFIKRTVKSQAILSLGLDQSQIIANVPPLVQALVASNDSLSTSGIGPVKSGGVPLYAGRWLDQASGRVRILPNASIKTVNPKSYGQMKGYHQARIINHWNNYVNSVEQYKDFIQTQNDATLRQKIQTKIERATDQDLLVQQQKDKIINSMRRFALEGTSYAETVFWNNLITPQQASELYETRSAEVANKQIKNIVERNLVRIVPDNSKDPGVWQAYNKIQLFALNMVNLSLTKKRNALKTVIRAGTIPQNMTPYQLAGLTQKMEQMNSTLSSYTRGGNVISLSKSGLQQILNMNGGDPNTVINTGIKSIDYPDAPLLGKQKNPLLSGSGGQRQQDKQAYLDHLYNLANP